MLPLTPEEARTLESSRQIKTAVKLAGVRVTIERTGDGWVRLTLRGAHAAIEEAKSRIEAIVTPTEERDAAAAELAAGGAYGGELLHHISKARPVRGCLAPASCEQLDECRRRDFG